MFDQCLKLLFIFGSYNAVVRGEDYDYYYDEYSTTTTPTTSLPTTTLTTSSRPSTTQRIVGDYDYDLACSFDSNGLCAWWNDPGANQSWLLNPLYDYTDVLMGDTAAYPFIYCDKPSPRGNNSIRLISPLYSRVLDKNGCFSNSFKMYTNSKSGFVGIRVYQKPDYLSLEDLIAYSDEAKKDYILYEVWGDWGNYWYEKESTLKHFDSNFQIIIEGIFGEDPMYIAISYVSIMQRTDCTGNTARPIPVPTTSTTILSTTTIASTTTTTKQLMPVNGFDSKNTQMITIIAILGIVLLSFGCILAVVLARQRGTYRLNELWANMVGTSSAHEAKPSDARYSTKDGDDAVKSVKIV